MILVIVGTTLTTNFQKGVKIINFENGGKDSVTVIGDYALSYSKTSISELKGNVIVINHSEKSVLNTEQLFWDQKINTFFREKVYLNNSNRYHSWNWF